MRRISIIFVAVFLLMIVAPPADALWWMVFHKPAFTGRVIDAETKEPIEGAVVVAVYEKETASFPEHYSTTIDVRETLTDKDGMFVIPSYTTIIQPLSVENPTRFIIFKPGYGSFPDYRVSPPLNKQLSFVPYGNNKYGESDLTFEEFFSGEIGIEKNFWARELYNTKDKPQKIKLTFGVVELPRLKTREERSKAIPSLPVFPEFLDKQKMLLELINKEEVNVGRTGKTDPYKAREFILNQGRK